MNAKRILCPIDFSSSSVAALEYASMLVHSSDGTLVILHVDDYPLAYSTNITGYGVAELEVTENNRRLAQTTPTVSGIRYEHRSATGDPAVAIVQVAKDENADLIVMGTHGKTGLTRLLMGSVAETVVRTAHCPVLTIRQPQEVLEPGGG